jgi:LmbE family N-acetylglucosaminyl deacetylase
MARGSAELRLQEAAEAAKILGINIRENAGFADGFFRNDKEHQLELSTIYQEIPAGCDPDQRHI